MASTRRYRVSVLTSLGHTRASGANRITAFVFEDRVFFLDSDKLRVPSTVSVLDIRKVSLIRSIIISCAICLLGLLAADGSVAQQPLQNRNTISGHVTDDHRVPIPDLRVELLNDVDSVLRTVKTDGSGLFVFRALSDGVFHVRVQTYGTNYLSQTRRVELARTGFGSSNEQLEIMLVANRPSSTGTTPGVVFVQDVPQAARAEYDRALPLLQKPDQLREGMKALKKAIDIFPRYFAALELLGAEHVKQKEFETAIPLLTQALEINSRAFASAYALGVAQYNLKDLPLAAVSLRRANSLNPKSINASLMLGMVLRQLGKLEEAETHLKQAESAQAKVPDVHWQLALLYNQLKRSKEAADQLELFLKLQPDSRDAELIKKLIQRLRQQSSNSGNKLDSNASRRQ